MIKPAAGLWQESSLRRIETPVGERLRVWFGRQDDGQPSAHGMLAGQTGSGKSYLLHVVISGLAARYAPSELQFYLIDGKQGVEFEVYRKLPHAAVVCLRTSPEMARSVVEDYVAEMRHRYERFQREGVADLEAWRKKSGQPMPRLLMIVDEYQQILLGDPERGAALLGELGEKGRAAGVHVLLGSQNFSAPGLPSSFFSHIHLRIALALSPDYVQGLPLFGTEGRRLIRDLPQSGGQVVINDESGRDGANRRGAVARLSGEGGTNSLRQIVAELGQARHDGVPVNIDGRDPPTLAENPFVRRFCGAVPDDQALQGVARTSVRDGGFGIASWSRADRPLPLWLGRRFDVHGRQSAVLTRLPQQHILVLGHQAELRLAMVASALAALSAFMPANGLVLDVIEDLRAGMAGDGMLDEAVQSLAQCGFRATRHRADGLTGLLAELSVELEHRQGSASQDNPTRLLVLAEPEYLSALATPTQGFAPPPPGPPTQLRELLARGPQVGIHVLLTASGVSSLQNMLHPSRELRNFNHRVCQQVNEDDSMVLFGSLVGAKVQERTEYPGACVAISMMQGARSAAFFKPYLASTHPHAEQDAAALRATFDAALVASKAGAP